MNEWITSKKGNVRSLCWGFSCSIIKSKWHWLLGTTRQPCQKHKDLLSCYALSQKWCWTVGLSFALVFSLDLFQLPDLLFIIDNTIKSESAIKFLGTRLLCLFKMAFRFSYYMLAACETRQLLIFITLLPVLKIFEIRSALFFHANDNHKYFTRFSYFGVISLT